MSTSCTGEGSADTTNQAPSLHSSLVSPTFRFTEFHTITLIHEPEKPVVGPQAIAQAGNSQCAQLGSQASEATSQVPQVSQSPGQR